jgi:hypothetical protein
MRPCANDQASFLPSSNVSLRAPGVKSKPVSTQSSIDVKGHNVTSRIYPS